MNGLMPIVFTTIMIRVYDDGFVLDILVDHLKENVGTITSVNTVKSLESLSRGFYDESMF